MRGSACFAERGSAASAPRSSSPRPSEASTRRWCSRREPSRGARVPRARSRLIEHVMVREVLEPSSDDRGSRRPASASASPRSNGQAGGIRGLPARLRWSVPGLGRSGAHPRTLPRDARAERALRRAPSRARGALRRASSLPGHVAQRGRRRMRHRFSTDRTDVRGGRQLARWARGALGRRAIWSLQATPTVMVVVAADLAGAPVLGAPLRGRRAPHRRGRVRGPVCRAARRPSGWPGRFREPCPMARTGSGRDRTGIPSSGRTLPVYRL